MSVIHQIMLHVYVIATLAIKVESLIFVIYNHIKISYLLKMCNSKKLKVDQSRGLNWK